MGENSYMHMHRSSQETEFKKLKNGPYANSTWTQVVIVDKTVIPYATAFIETFCGATFQGCPFEFRYYFTEQLILSIYIETNF